jgi:AcrR family transcriptional regulator
MVALTERRRGEIVDVAATMFAATGYAETDVQLIADRIGVGKGTVYRYFGSKEELFFATVDVGMKQLQAAISEAAAQATSDTERIELGIRGYLRYFDEHPELIELLILERAHFRARKRPTYFVHRDANLGPWRDLFTRLMDAGVIRRISVDRVTDVISDLLYGTIFTNHFAGRKKSLTSQCEDVLDVLFQGLLVRTQ